MAKKAINPKEIKSSLKSVRNLPFTPAEIKELEAIQDKEYWARKPLKEQFCDRNDRLITEVDEYFKKYRRPPLSGGQRGTIKTKKDFQDNARDISGSISAPKEQVTKIPEAFPSSEIRITFKRMVVEGNVIIFEV